MSSEQSSVSAAAAGGGGGGKGLLRGNRTRSYGSLVRTPLSPVRQLRIEHQVQPGDTLQGLALKYGVSTEQIKRMNKLYTNDSIFLKKSLSIPALTNPDLVKNGAQSTEESENGQREDRTCTVGQANGTDDGPACWVEGESEISPVDFLKRIDCSINLSKQAAIRKIAEGEKGFLGVDQFHSQRLPASQDTEGYSVSFSPGAHQRAMLGAVPLTITKHARKLKDREDEIFEL